MGFPRKPVCCRLGRKAAPSCCGQWTGSARVVVADRRGGRLYVTGDVGDDLVMFAFDLGGKRLAGQERGGLAGSFPGARACCAFSQGRLYQLNAHGRLACLDAAKGNEVWAVNVLERFSARTSRGHQRMSAGRRAAGHRDAWRAQNAGGGVGQTNRPNAVDQRSVGRRSTSYSSPILFRFAGRRLIANCSGAHGFGVDADSGKLLWTVPLRNRFDINVATPVYGDGQVFYVTPYAEEGRRVSAARGGDRIEAQQAWQIAAGYRHRRRRAGRGHAVCRRLPARKAGSPSIGRPAGPGTN